MKQYFDHYLKDALAPLWMTKGIDQLDKKRLGPEVMETDNLIIGLLDSQICAI